MKKSTLFLALIFFVSALFAQQSFNRGMNFDDKTYKKVPMKAPLTRSLYGSSLPASASLKKWAPIPKTQGSFGTCTAWSSTYCARTIVESIKNNWTDKTTITDNAFAPGFVYNLSKLSGDINCSSGTYINNALDIIKTKGVPKYSEFQESCPASISSEFYDKASSFKIKDYAKIFDTDDGVNFKIQAAKKSLSENKPVVIGMKCPASFENAKDCWIPTEDFNQSFGGHAMCVVGYDDSQYGGAFEIQNSWGTWWGNEGYIWIKYTDFANWVKYAYELIEDFNTPINTIYDLSGKVRFMLSNNTEMAASLQGQKYRMNKTYKSGTHFRMYISNDQPAFVYAIGSDLTSAIYSVFPYADNISPVLNYIKNEVALPDEDHWVEMDDKLGTDILCVLFCKDMIDFKGIQKALEKETGTFQERISKVIGSDLIDNSNITYLSDNQIGFKAKSQGKKIVALLVETIHVN